MPRIPASTYRIQFNRDFGFAQAAALLDYLDALGVTDVYASPIAAARAGSLHGYDVVDHGRLNPELGTEEDFARFAGDLRARGMGLILDVVPNHMCIADPASRWWLDVLENGPSSPYARFFDIDWHPPKADLANKVLLPVLGDQYGRVLESQEIRVVYGDGAFRVEVYGLALPTAPRTAALVLEPALRELRRRGEGEDDRGVLELESIITAISHIPPRTETNRARIRERHREKEVVKGRLAALVEGDEVVRGAVEATVAEMNGRKGDPRSFDLLESFLAAQAYRLSSWRVAADEINYRRFFDVNDLAAIRVEEPPVFAAAHELALGFLHAGLATGLRIDHVDGLFDPEKYLRDLERASGGAYTIVEKVLEPGEPLPRKWPVHGTTGYEALNLLGGLFVDASAGSGRALRETFARATGETRSFADVVYHCKRLALHSSLSGELHVLARRLDRISEQHRWSRDFTLHGLHDALREVVACFPVYRTYVRAGEEPVDPEDRKRIEAAVACAKRRNPVVSGSIFDFVGAVVLGEDPDGLEPLEREARREFVMRFQQLTGPVMAKGLEDTAFYRWFPLASLCEVGGSPAAFGTPLDAFHRACAERLAAWPHGLTATSTHDTKRSEDARARIHALSEVPEEWAAALERWRERNRAKKRDVGGAEAPDASEEVLLYQTLVGTWPLEPLDGPGRAAYAERIQQYMTKARKEAKVETSWVNPNEAYDAAGRAFVEAVLGDGEFLADLADFARPLARAGLLTSLSQTLLKIAMPGVPDFYQGTELLDFSLVDPDNRRPVDWKRRRALLAEVREEAERDPAGLAARLAAAPEDGRAKLHITSRALAFRRANRELFERGSYEPIEARGERERHVVAFARRAGRQAAIAVAARFFVRLGPWGETALEGAPPGRWRDIFTGREPRSWKLRDIFSHLPVALLERIA